MGATEHGLEHNRPENPLDTFEEDELAAGFEDILAELMGALDGGEPDAIVEARDNAQKWLEEHGMQASVAGADVESLETLLANDGIS